MKGFQNTKEIAEFIVSLYCKGLRLTQSAKGLKELLVKRRAGLGSGLEIKVHAPKKNFWANIPIEEKFVVNSPYQLAFSDENSFYIEIQNIGKKIPVEVISPPEWYMQKTSRGIAMSKIGVMQGTYLGIYLGNTCKFWTMSPSQACKFCATGLNVGVHEAEEKTVADVIEVAQMAKQKSGITFVHLNSGYQQGNDLKQMIPYIQALKKEVGVLIGIQTIPPADLSEYDALIQAGVDHFSFCYEFHNPEYFNRYLPGKSQYVGQKHFFSALEYVAKRTMKGSVSGEIIAGIEPISDTLAGVDYITSCGAFPTVCIFRPLLHTSLEDHPSPLEEDMLTVLRYVAESCIKKGIPIGMAPNLEVSLVMTPDDCRFLLPQSFSWYTHYYKLKLLKWLATPIFAWKRRKV